MCVVPAVSLNTSTVITFDCQTCRRHSTLQVQPAWHNVAANLHIFKIQDFVGLCIYHAVSDPLSYTSGKTMLKIQYNGTSVYDQLTNAATSPSWTTFL